MGLKIIFMGTPAFAVPVLEALARLPYQMVGVITQPDRASGRGRHLAESPVKKSAIVLGIPVFQPEKLSAPEAFEQLSALAPDLIVVAAYGHILKKDVLSLPRFGCLNVHPSLLPKHRGASPVAGAILAGDEETGVTIMLMDEGMDTGPVLSRVPAPVLPQDTTGSLAEKLARIGADLLVETVPLWVEGKLKPQPQDNSRATYTRVIMPQDGLLDWKLAAQELWLRVRAFSPWPGSYTFWKGRRLKVIEVAPVGVTSDQPGKVVPLPAGSLSPVGVTTGSGALGLLRVQLEGKRELAIDEFLRGSRDFVGSVLG
ncbi:MAG: methionyl-tRNA formyltransferase [Chloroflexota bacterium]